MGLIEIASGNSVWRGMDYYNEKKLLVKISLVLTIQKYFTSVRLSDIVWADKYNS